MSQIFTSAAVIILAQVLPIIGLNLGNEQVTTFAQVAVSILAALWVMVRRHQQGDITVVGSRK